MLADLADLADLAARISLHQLASACIWLASACITVVTRFTPAVKAVRCIRYHVGF
jgi:hypothetical protein